MYTIRKIDDKSKETKCWVLLQTLHYHAFDYLNPNKLSTIL